MSSGLSICSKNQNITEAQSGAALCVKGDC